MRTYDVSIIWHNHADSRIVMGYDKRDAIATVKSWCPGARITSCHEYAPPGGRGHDEIDLLTRLDNIGRAIIHALLMHRG